ncbi:hypothetical protein [Propionicimonas sp.]|uniref:hypothetical protein n=1 Tax=Propionicimonas sp. TaxID=1955623 RepID=UPI0039E23B6F
MSSHIALAAMLPLAAGCVLAFGTPATPTPGPAATPSVAAGAPSGSLTTAKAEPIVAERASSPGSVAGRHGAGASRTPVSPATTPGGGLRQP